VNESKSKVREMTPDEVLQKMKSGEKFHFVDCREDDEWREGHAEGAIHIGRGVIERDIEEEIPNKNEMVVLVCAGGSRSALAAESIQKLGYKNVISMSGGMREWEQKGFPMANDS
jgi:rhodanese-related sulfurtransferase